MRALALAIVLLSSILRPVSHGPGFVFAVLSTVVLAGTNADASLRPSADGKTIYDSTLKVTWLADANLAATETFGVEGINPGGLMSWNTAQNWVAAMNAANYLGHHTWRLPATKQPDAACTQKTSLGSFAYHCIGSEMGALFYRELGGAKGSSVLQARSSSVRVFRNFQPYLYWSGTVYPVVGKSSWSFSFGNGFQGTNLNANAMYTIPLFPETGGSPAPPPANEGIGVVPRVNAQPSLEAGGNGRTVYDRALNVTWLADANLAATQTFGVKGINPNGSMSWHTAENWIAAMNAAHYLGRGGWRLPKTPQPDDSCSIITPKLKQGSGYNCTRSEMGELFYTELGSRAGSSLERTHDRYLELFHNFQQYLYWSEADPELSRVGAWTFSFGNGFQGSNFFSNDIYVIPVVDGPIEKP